jgi:hypothetical protein
MTDEQVVEPATKKNFEMIQYIYKTTKSGKKTNEKVGVMVAFPDENKTLNIGFSKVWRALDSFDYVDGKRKPGHGRKMTKTRAVRWLNKPYCEIVSPNSDYNSATVYVPFTVAQRLAKFIIRCCRYYKDVQCYPQWVLDFEKKYPDLFKLQQKPTPPVLENPLLK